RSGSPDEPVEALYQRVRAEIDLPEDDERTDDVEDQPELEGVDAWKPDPALLEALLREGVTLLEADPNRKWELLFDRVLHDIGHEKVVLFAQPIETVTTLATYIRGRTGRAPSIIIGGQDEATRGREIEDFWRSDGPQFLVSSRAGGEGLNLQVARRLVHVDVPWNPMELEQRIGRVHRFQSKRTILVDTLVVKDSREVDTYKVARKKLREIATAMVVPERFDELFSRVMALVPPDALGDVMAGGATGPLDDGSIRKVSELVTKGFQQWESFHKTYAEGRLRLSALNAGEASWEDLALFLERHTDAKPVEGYSMLKFTFVGREVEESSVGVPVYELNYCIEFFARNAGHLDPLA
ncbi:hypothetical protein EON82_26125, partial [bacterium]